jgi:protein O-mannosyl-transferase
LLRGILRALFHSARSGDAAAAIGAAFFVLHPLQVESVAWISGLRDVLGGCLGLGALVVLFGGGRLSPLRWSGASVLFLASLSAKPAGVALPLVAGLLAAVAFCWPWRRMALALGPWLLAGAVWVIVTSNAQWAADLARDLVPVWMRPLVAADALAFYLGKSAWPLGLSADYGRSPNIALAAGWLWWTWLFPAGIVAVLYLVRPLRIFLLPLGIFTAALLPTLGMVPFNFQVVSTVADRYAYFALLGPALALAMLVMRASRAPVTAAAAALVLVFGFLSAQRIPLWSEDLRLFAATLEVNPRSWKAMHNYASALDDRGRSAEAEPLLRKVIALRPDSAEAHNDLSVILWNLNRREEAIIAMRQSINLRPTSSSARNLVQMEAMQNNRAGVIEALQVVVNLEPGNAEVAEQLRQLQNETAP